MRRSRVAGQSGIIRGVIQRLACRIVGGTQGAAALALDRRHFVGGLQFGLERNGFGERRRSQDHGRRKPKAGERRTEHRVHFGSSQWLGQAARSSNTAMRILLRAQGGVAAGGASLEPSL